MRLAELIIRAHVHIHASELAVKANQPEEAWNELHKLSRLLDNKPHLGTGNKSKPPRPE